MSDYFPPYMHIPSGVDEFSARDNVYRLFYSALKGDIKEAARVLPHFKPSLQGHTLEERLAKWKLLLEDNIANLHHLSANVKSPVKNWLHTGHVLYRSLDSGIWRMDHYWLENHVCTDVLKENPGGTFLGKGDVSFKWRRFDRLARIILNGAGCEEQLSTNEQYVTLWGSSGNALLENLSMPPYLLLPARLDTMIIS